MPHFMIECSEDVLTMQPAETILRAVHNCADASGLFNTKDIKVRITPFQKGMYLVSGNQTDFLHVFSYIKEGRSTENKGKLAQDIVKVLKELLPSIPFIAININDFELATYCNRNMV